MIHQHRNGKGEEKELKLSNSYKIGHHKLVYFSSREKNLPLQNGQQTYLYQAIIPHRYFQQYTNSSRPPHPQKTMKKRWKMKEH